MALIYILEDDRNIREIEEIALKNADYEVVSFETAAEFGKRLKERVPDLLLLDEPLAALDLLCKKGILDYLKEYTGNGGSIIVATHEEDALSICNRIYILKDGLLQEANGADYASMLRA